MLNIHQNINFLLYKINIVKDTKNKKRIERRLADIEKDESGKEFQEKAYRTATAMLKKNKYKPSSSSL